MFLFDLRLPYLPVYNAQPPLFSHKILALKSRCTLYMEPFVFIEGNLQNNTKSAKSNNSQFYATSRNKSRQKVCLASFHIRQCQCRASSISHQSCNLFVITIENLLYFLKYFDDSKFHEEFSFRLSKSIIH